MKKLTCLLAITFILSGNLFSETYYENGLTFNSPEILGMGNVFTAEAEGLAAFEFNPAGLNSGREFELSAGLNFISNLAQLNDDLLSEYNENTGTEFTLVDSTVLDFFMDEENRTNLIKVLLNQVSEPYGDNLYANGLGASSVLSLGYTGKGLGIGATISMDYEAYGTDLLTSEINNVVTASLLLGYGQSLNLGIIKVDLGAALRPMYKIRSNGDIADTVTLLEDDDLFSLESEAMEDLTYLTGIGVGVDFGAKVHFMDLTAGLSIMDFGGTSILYYKSNYTDIVNGDYLGSEEVEDDYITPATVNLGLSYNPQIGSMNKKINPTIAADYNLVFIDDGDVEDYMNQGSFWNNLSLGADLELFESISVRGGLNQGYVTLGAGLKLFVLDINAAVYSFELGEQVGERQQMGAVLEFAIRI